MITRHYRNLYIPKCVNEKLLFRPQYITYLLGMLIEIDSMLNCTLRYGINLFSRNSNNNVVEINHLYYMSRMR